MEEKKIEFKDSKSLLNQSISEGITVSLSIVAIYYIFMVEAMNNFSSIGGYMYDFRFLAIIVLLVFGIAMSMLPVFMVKQQEAILKENELYCKNGKTVHNIPYSEIDKVVMPPLAKDNLFVVKKDGKKVAITYLESTKNTMKDIMERVNAVKTAN